MAGGPGRTVCAISMKPRSRPRTSPNRSPSMPMMKSRQRTTLFSAFATAWDGHRVGGKARSRSRRDRERSKNLPGIQGLFIFDADGNWVASSDAVTPRQLKDNYRAYFQISQITRRPRRSSRRADPQSVEQSPGHYFIPPAGRFRGQLHGRHFRNDPGRPYAGVLQHLRYRSERHYTARHGDRHHHRAEPSRR